MKPTYNLTHLFRATHKLPQSLKTTENPSDPFFENKKVLLDCIKTNTKESCQSFCTKLRDMHKETSILFKGFPFAELIDEETGNTVLHWICENNFESAMETMIELQVYFPNSLASKKNNENKEKGLKEETPIAIAIRKNNLNLVKMLTGIYPFEIL